MCGRGRRGAGGWPKGVPRQLACQATRGYLAKGGQGRHCHPHTASSNPIVQAAPFSVQAAPAVPPDAGPNHVLTYHMYIVLHCDAVDIYRGSLGQAVLKLCGEVREHLLCTWQKIEPLHGRWGNGARCWASHVHCATSSWMELENDRKISCKGMVVAPPRASHGDCRWGWCKGIK